MAVLYLLMRGRTPEALQAYRTHLPHHPTDALQAALQDILSSAAQLLPPAQQAPTRGLQDFVPNMVAASQQQTMRPSAVLAHDRATPVVVVGGLLFGGAGSGRPSAAAAGSMPPHQLDRVLAAGVHQRR